MIIELADGETFLVGTRKPEQFLEAMRKSGVQSVP
jgi:hypothetical protein